ncbi:MULTISPECIES: response regulator [Limnobacter]|uniref:Response regulator n=1 Tax=Limnobacter litoralis TaxID=481366 RepID=A0ABQ5YVC2_9BURK|nr:MULTISPECIES: response regulator [Limnobacter]GLR26719.1 response regulator [Limnobacter litoralis]HEX5484384.1 response regulator [Limnobacter sp.]
MTDVVLVDDNSNDADLALRVVRKTASNSSTVLLEDGERAIEYFRQLMDSQTDEVGPNLPKLLLLDLKLPKLDGLEVLRFLRSHEVFNTMPIVVLSSSREISDVRKAYELGVNSFAVKPVQFDQYLTRISALVSYWLTINELPRGA